ncbi:hypothetical protein ACKS0A_00159 [Histoplasma ohiense]
MILQHILLDLIHNLRRLHRTLRLKVISLLLTRRVSPQHHHPETLRMPPANLRPHNVIKRYRRRLAVRFEERLARLRRHDMHVVHVEREHALIRRRERHGLLADDVVAPVVATQEILGVRERVQHATASRATAALLALLGTGTVRGRVFDH